MNVHTSEAYMSKCGTLSSVFLQFSDTQMTLEADDLVRRPDADVSLTKSRHCLINGIRHLKGLAFKRSAKYS